MPCLRRPFLMKKSGRSFSSATSTAAASACWARKNSSTVMSISSTVMSVEARRTSGSGPPPGPAVRAPTRGFPTARRLRVVDRLLEARELGVGQGERDADDPPAVRATPLVGQVARGPEVAEPLLLQLAVEHLDVELPGRAPQAQPALADAL